MSSTKLTANIILPRPFSSHGHTPTKFPFITAGNDTQSRVRTCRARCPVHTIIVRQIGGHLPSSGQRHSAASLYTFSELYGWGSQHSLSASTRCLSRGKCTVVSGAPRAPHAVHGLPPTNA